MKLQALLAVIMASTLVAAAPVPNAEAEVGTVAVREVDEPDSVLGYRRDVDKADPVLGYRRDAIPAANPDANAAPAAEVQKNKKRHCLNPLKKRSRGGNYKREEDGAPVGAL